LWGDFFLLFLYLFPWIACFSSHANIYTIVNNINKWPTYLWS
jgi:hypothetical protein